MTTEKTEAAQKAVAPKAPAPAPGAALSDTQRQFRSAMAQLSAAVTVVTSDGAAGRCGVTASAVCSVTDSPPTILVCLNRSSAMHDVFASNREICVNVLAGEHEEVARDFAGLTAVPMAERFEAGAWEFEPQRAPLLKAALVGLRGRIVESSIVGTHSVFFVELDTIRVREDGEALVYFKRSFQRLGVAVDHGA